MCNQHQSIYPTKDSLGEAAEYIKSQLPVTNFNDFYALSMIYQNTLRKVQEEANNESYLS